MAEEGLQWKGNQKGRIMQPSRLLGAEKQGQHGTTGWLRCFCVRYEQWKSRVKLKNVNGGFYYKK